LVVGLAKRLKVEAWALPRMTVVAAMVDHDGLVGGAAPDALEIVALKNLQAPALPANVLKVCLVAHIHTSK
jgi:hypothetical protein